MPQIQLKTYQRNISTKGANRKLRLEGSTPGIIYGKGMESTSIFFNKKDFLRAISQPAGLNVIFDLLVQDGESEKSVTAMVKEIQRQIITYEILHVDFQAISLEETIAVLVPLKLLGMAKGIAGGGVLQQNLHQVEVECLPTAIPQFLELDVTNLDIGDSFFARDLALPEGISLVTEGMSALITLVPPLKEEVPAEAVAPAAEQVLPAEKMLAETEENKESQEEQR